MTELAALSAPLLALVAAATVPLMPSERWANRLNAGLAAAVGLAGAGTAAWALSGNRLLAGEIQVDALGGVFLLASAVLGLLSAWTSRAYLARRAGGRRWYHLGFHLFWAALLAIPL